MTISDVLDWEIQVHYRKGFWYFTENSKTNQKPEFSKNPKIFKKTIYFFRTYGESLFFRSSFDFLVYLQKFSFFFLVANKPFCDHTFVGWWLTSVIYKTRAMSNRDATTKQKNLNFQGKENDLCFPKLGGNPVFSIVFFIFWFTLKIQVSVFCILVVAPDWT